MAVINVLGNDWRLEQLSLPVGKHRLYAQQYTYTATPKRKPLTDAEIKSVHKALCGTSYGSDYMTVARAIEAAHNIKDTQ